MKRLLCAALLACLPLAPGLRAADAPVKFGALHGGDPVPDFTVKGADGKDLKLSDLAGHVLVINFWSPARGPADALQSAWAKYQDQNLRVLAICTGGTREDFDAWVAKTKDATTYVLAWDPAGKTLADTVEKKVFGVATTPATAVVGRDQHLLTGFFGFGSATGPLLRGGLRDGGLAIAPEAVPPPPPPPEPREDHTLKPGTVPPEFTTFDLAGAPVKLADFAGKIVVLDFWATWCGPCLNSMPHNQHVAAGTKTQDVVLLAACTDDSRAAFEKWMQANAAKYPDVRFAIDPAERSPQRASAKLYGVTGIPTQFVIGRDGKIVEVIVGYGPGDPRLEQTLAKLGVKVAP